VSDRTWSRLTPWLVGAAFFVVGLMGAVLLELDHRRTSAFLEETVAGADRLARVRVELARAFAVASRTAAGDPTVDPGQVRAPLAEAERHLDEWALGRSTFAGIGDMAPPGPELLALVDAYRDLVREFGRGLSEPATLNALEARTRFADAERGAGRLEAEAYAILLRAMEESRRDHHRLVMFWLGVVALLSALGVAVGRARGAALRERMAAERRYRSIVEYAPVGIAETLRDGTIATTNDEFARILGYESAGELVEARLNLATDVYVDPDDRDRLVAELDGAGELRDWELAWRRRDGEVITVRADGVRRPTDDDEEGEAGGAYLALVTDVTRERALEAQLNHAQKMEAVGTLAGGIAHDFNNLLTPILVNTEFALEDLPPGHPGRSDLEEIRSAAQRASELTSRILSFSRRQDIRPRVTDLNEVVRGVEQILRRTLPASIQLELDAHTSPCVTRIDPGELEQILVNLVVNARDAMPDGGTVALETRHLLLDEAYADEHLDVEPGAYVAIDVSDTGHGIDAATCARIFDPFFTTKAPGKGTGLGLSTVYGIVNRLGGHVRVYSEPGQGTLFRVYLPEVAAADAAHSSRTVPTADPDASTRVTRILVVEDDEKVLKAALRSLERDGHRASSAPDAASALARFDASDEPFGLVLSDVVLPDMDGRELVARLRERVPHLPTIFMSGYTERSVRRRAAWTDDAAFIQKPFTASGLCAQVQEVLRRQGG
jgi:two-component system, cell cycle sensor histidine kinase and response regulator CckA